jgi:diguanylate cyclase (GGDEF)-like protein
MTRERAERLCEHARRLSIHFEGQAFEMITLSVGIEAFPKHGSTSAEILKTADIALYRAKHEGRDRVIVASQ